MSSNLRPFNDISHAHQSCCTYARPRIWLWFISILTVGSFSIPANAQTFSTPGSWSYTVPAGVTKVQVSGGGGGGGGGAADGAKGGNGGNGGKVTAIITVTPRQVLSGTIGQGGGSAFTSGSTLFGYVPCTGSGAGGTGRAAGGNGAAANCPGFGDSGNGAGGGGGGGFTAGTGGSSFSDIFAAIAGGGGGSCHHNSMDISSISIAATGRTTRAPTAGPAGSNGSVVITPGPLEVQKTSTVAADAIRASNFKSLPGATIRYCIVIRNNWGGDATDVILTDSLPAQTGIVANSFKRYDMRRCDQCGATGFRYRAR